MNISSIHPHRSLYLRETEEAYEALEGLRKDGFCNIPKIARWLLKYEELYQYSYAHRHVGSCFERMGCKCTWEVPECKFSELYSDLEEAVELHKHEKYFKGELAEFEKVKEDQPALMKWLKKNEVLGTEDFLLFWQEWYEEDQGIVKPFLMGHSELDIKFRAEEWKNSLEFCKIFNEIYWTSYPNADQ